MFARKSPSQSRPGRFNRGSDMVNLCARLLDPFVRWVLQRCADRFPSLCRAYDGLILRHRMRRSLGYRPNLRHPQTYNEKIAWRILNDRNPLIVATTDKLAVREYVAAKVGPDVLIPIIGVYQSAADIRWAELPNQFVLKASHGCDMTLIVRDKDSIDPKSALERADAWMRQNYYELSRERAYRDIPRRIIVEQLLTDDEGRIPADYKILVFHGRASLIRVHTDRFDDHRVNYYDADFRPLPMAQISPSAPAFTVPIEARSLIGLAEKLAGDFDYARIDLYLARGKTWFGEITHHDGNAHVRFQPPEFDAALGAMWHLPLEAQDKAVRERSTISAEWTPQPSCATSRRDGPHPIPTQHLLPLDTHVRPISL